MSISWSRPIVECIDCLSVRRCSGRRGNRNSRNNGFLKYHEWKADEPREKHEKPWIGRIRHQSGGGVNGKEDGPEQQADAAHGAAERVALNLPFSFVPHNRCEKVKVEWFPFVSRRWVVVFKRRAFLTRCLKRDSV